METHLQLLSEDLRAASVDVDVLVANTGPRTIRETVRGISVTRAGTVSTLMGAPLCPGMITAIRSSKADIVHLHLPNPAATLAYMASGHSGPLILTYHSDIVRQKVLGRVFEPILRHTLRRSAATIVATRNHVDASPVLWDFRDRCRIIPYGIAAAAYEQQASTLTNGTRHSFGPRIVLGIGRLVGYKGFTFLVDAMASVAGHLLLIGDGPLRAALERRAASLALQDRVSFLGEVDDVVPYLYAADVFVLPSVSRNEAFGIVQLEAMACGVPVINTSLDSGVPFVSIDGVTGLTVPPANAAALAGAINTLLDDPARRAAYGAAARCRVQQEFGVNTMTRLTLELYEEVMAAQPRRARPANRYS
jgi:glycosyltransferase involved in cell wall biosynthesis